MAELSELDRELLEYETGFLSGLMGVSWGEPEMVSRYATRYSIVLALLGRTKESDYQHTMAKISAPFIGNQARQAWNKRPRHLRLFATRKAGAQWQHAYTQSLFIEADDNLRRVKEDVDSFRAFIAHYFDESGERIVADDETPADPALPFDKECQPC